MGAGFHGISGLKAVTCMQIYKCYLLPVLLYGLETINPKKEAPQKLGRFHIGILKSIQSAPKCTSNAATYLMVGSSPVEAYLHKRTLTFLGNLLRSSNDKMRDWSLYMAGSTSGESNSFFSYVIKLLQVYKLPSFICSLQ
jgi:hypothetical protein